MKKLLMLAFVGLLASCGSTPQAPRNLDDACALAREKPRYFNAMKKTEARWGIPVAVQMATFHQESKFVGNARTPYRFTLGVIPMGRQSSAYGYSQALDSTWDNYRKQTRHFSARRNKFNDAADFMGWYMDGSSRQLGIARSDARSQYLAYHEGRGGYARGNHNAKPWLLAVADRVQARARMYDSQLASCRRR